uniref:NB-ARC domain-containing protein n=1 Tax=Musa acuminata subsp. malaccensis TaxID=214687 RepID=A0A804HQ15_MUSAM
MATGERSIQHLMEEITNPDVGTVVVHGISGLGKTWTARQAYGRAMASPLFDVFLWISLSVTCTKRRARQKILESLSIVVEDNGDEERVTEKIHSFLSGRRFLLVLDDAWFTEDRMLATLGVPTPRHNASKVVVTTRTMRTQTVMEPDVVIQQSSLSRKESWDLFCQISGHSIVNRFGQMVVEGSHGMPLLIVLMAGALKDSITDSANEELTAKVSSALLNEVTAARFAYSMLPDDEVKHCLVYCLLFPGDMALHDDELIQYWLMDGLIAEGYLSVAATDKAQKILLLLLHRRLLYRDDDDHVRMHEAVREVLMDTGRQRGDHGYSCATHSEGLTSIWFPDGRNKRISLMESSTDRLPQIPQSFLSSLFLRGIRWLKVIPNSFFDNRQILTLSVLDLSFTAITNLPSSTSNLANLQYLLLKGCEHLEELRNIRSLRNLLVLDASGCSALRTISPGSFAMMNMLRVLDLSRTSIESFPSLSRLPELRCLFLRGCRRINFQEKFPYGITKTGHLLSLKLCTESNAVDWNVMQWLQAGLTWDEHAGVYASINTCVDDNRSYLSVSNTSFFQYLDKDSPLWDNCFLRFHIRVCPSEEANRDSEFVFQNENFVFRETYFGTKYCSHPPNACRFLEIHHVRPWGIGGVLHHADVVFLNDVKLVKQLSDFELQNLRGMRECWIQRCDQMESIFTAELEDVSEVLSLEKLWISNLEKLSFLFAGVEKETNFTSLKHIHIDCCPNLVGLFCSTLRFQNLETLQIRFCDKLESVYDHSVIGEEAFPRLHTLRLWELPELKSVCGGILPCLKHLKVKECPKLKALPVGVNDMTPIAIIRGERQWWNNLTWEDERIKSHLLFRRWGRF